jgi:thioredoxin 1
MIVQLTDETFDQEVLQSDKVVFVDCYAEWCAPCKALAPVLHELEAENTDIMSLCLLDVDNNAKTAVRLKISSIPKVVVFKNGIEIKSLIGLHKKEEFEQFLS